MANKNEELDVQSQLLLRELEDEHRRAQLVKLWKTYQPFVFAGAFAIVAGVGGYKIYENQTQQRQAAQGARFEDGLKAAEAANADEARKAFTDLAENGSKGYAALARLQLAAADAKAGNTAAAVATYDAVADDGSADSLLRGFARLQAATLRSGTADWTEMQNRLNDLVGDKSPWRFSARELWGVAAMKAGKLDEARRAFEQLLTEPGTPPSIGQRAQLLMSQIVAAELAGSGNAGASPQSGTPPAKK